MSEALMQDTPAPTPDGPTLVPHLDASEREKLEQCELAIKKHLRSAMMLGKALAEVRDLKLYREDYSTFEEYCDKRWAVARRTAYRLMEYSETADNVTNWSHGEIAPPERESVARELARLPAEQQGEAWADIVEATGKQQPTAKEVREHVAELLPEPTGKRIGGGDFIEEVKGDLAGEQAEVVDEGDIDRDMWSTPEHIVNLARRILGGEIDLDPCTHARAQDEVVKATRHYTKEDDGLAQKWTGRFWMNPPYSQPACRKFTSKLLEEYQAGNVTQAVVLVNTASGAQWWQELARVAEFIVFPNERIQYWHPDLDETPDRNRFEQTLFVLGVPSAHTVREFELRDWLVLRQGEAHSVHHTRVRQLEVRTASTQQALDAAEKQIEQLHERLREAEAQRQEQGDLLSVGADAGDPPRLLAADATVRRTVECALYNYNSSKINELAGLYGAPIGKRKSDTIEAILDAMLAGPFEDAQIEELEREVRRLGREVRVLDFQAGGVVRPLLETRAQKMTLTRALRGMARADLDEFAAAYGISADEGCSKNALAEHIIVHLEASDDLVEREACAAPSSDARARLADVSEEIVSKMASALNKGQLVDLATTLEIDATGYAYELAPRVACALLGIDGGEE